MGGYHLRAAEGAGRCETPAFPAAQPQSTRGLLGQFEREPTQWRMHALPNMNLSYASFREFNRARAAATPLPAVGDQNSLCSGACVGTGSVVTKAHLADVLGAVASGRSEGLCCSPMGLSLITCTFRKGGAPHQPHRAANASIHGRCFPDISSQHPSANPQCLPCLCRELLSVAGCRSVLQRVTAYPARSVG